MSTITPEAANRCNEEAAHRAHLNALRAVEHALADKHIDDYYDALIRGDTTAGLDRRIFDRRANNHPWMGHVTRMAHKSPVDMADVDLHLSAP